MKLAKRANVFCFHENLEKWCDAGRERCYRVHWELPQPEPVGGEEEELSEEALIEACVRKDANEVLMKNGPDVLRLCIDQAEPLPIRGLFRWALPSLPVLSMGSAL